MRDFHQLPPAEPAGEPAGTACGDGTHVMITVSAGGAVMTPLNPVYGLDEFGATKDEHLVHRSRGQGTLHAAGCP